MITALKWTATSFIIVATICRALNLHLFDLVFGTVGAIMWAYCAYIMKDKALITVNVFCASVLILGLINT